MVEGDEMKKTKIIATIGPASNDEDTIRSMILAGLDVVRLNLTHANHKFCEDVMEKAKKLSVELDRNVAILLDTQGPDIRVGEIAKGSAQLTKGDKIRIYKNDVLGDRTKFSLNDKEIVDEVLVGSRIFVDDGKVELKVIDKGEGYLICEVKNEGYVASKKSVNICGTPRIRPFLSEKDIADIKFANKVGADFLAISFVSSSDDVLEVNDLLISLGNDQINIIAKVETEKAIQNIDTIISECDGIMIARGDLGVEIPMEKIPSIQKDIIHKCMDQGKISIVATEMLASMEVKIRPTRAEVSDVANAVIDGTDSVMLSGETAIGKYPIIAVETMKRIIKASEKNINYQELLKKAMENEIPDVIGLIAFSVADCANRLPARAVMVTTLSGTTARKLSRFRPATPIFALSPSPATIKSLSLHFGVIPILVKELNNFDKITKMAIDVAKERLELQSGEKILITGGYPFKENSPTNFMKIEEI